MQRKTNLKTTAQQQLHTPEVSRDSASSRNSDGDQHAPNSPNHRKNTTTKPPAKHKVRHRKVKSGVTIFKGHPSYHIMMNLRLGVAYTVGRLGGKSGPLDPNAFNETYKQDFPHEGSSTTPAHMTSSFKIKDHAPRVFRHLREHFGIDEQEYSVALCVESLRELGTPGKSGAVFYLTEDSRFILKTISKREAKFMRAMLPNYYAHVMGSANTLLPRFFGLLRITTAQGRNIRLVSMNNLIPEDAKIHEKYDLKGSTLGRYATDVEKAQVDVTLKDLDFLYRLYFNKPEMDLFRSQIESDCKFLRELGIMDYSLLALLHFPSRGDVDDEADVSPGEESRLSLTSSHRRPFHSSSASRNSDSGDEPDEGGKTSLPTVPDNELTAIYENSLQIRRKLRVDEGASPTMNFHDSWRAKINGEDVILYCGVIDILQQFGTRKMIEYKYKTFRYKKEKEGISVTNPTAYESRFLKFILGVFLEASSPTGSREKDEKWKSTAVPQNIDAKLAAVCELDQAAETRVEAKHGYCFINWERAIEGLKNHLCIRR